MPSSWRALSKLVGVPTDEDGRATVVAQQPQREPRPGPEVGAPTAVVGMVGGGQLARMTQQAAIGLGVELQVLTAHDWDPAVTAGARFVPGDPGDLEALLALAKGSDVVTFDHEHVPNAHLRTLEDAGHLVRPSPAAKLLAQDKTIARQVLGDAGFVIPPFADVPAGDIGAASRFADAHGWPLVIKAPRGGYDGRGVDVIASTADLVGREDLGSDGRWLLEAHVDIVVELAVLVARRPNGQSVTYPVVETVQRDGICHELVMPARIPPDVAARAEATATAIAEHIGATGILAIELFVTADGDLVINELAARPHNSGHATIEGATTSQFENHLRAVLDWPLGAPTLVAPAAATVNLLGPPEPIDLSWTAPRALEDPHVHLHLYAKAYAPGRKLGHVTVLADDAETALQTARTAADALLRP
jgi:5-(carboxyamino)imidazole ribonucleotide synthase